jgi:hypothetical protein
LHNEDGLLLYIPLGHTLLASDPSLALLLPGDKGFLTAVVFRTLSRSLTCGLTPSFASTFLALFFASLLATQSASADFIYASLSEDVQAYRRERGRLWVLKGRKSEPPVLSV